MSSEHDMHVRSRTVLIVEDEPRLQDMLSRAVRDMEFEVRAASSGEAALHLLADAPSDIMIVDLNLPGMSGLEFCEQVRTRWPSAQCIILTGFGDLDAARKAMRLDVVDFLTKPCALGDIEVSLDRALRRHRNGVVEGRVAAAPVAIPDDLEACDLDVDAGDENTLEAVERRCILDALARHDGNRAQAAEELGISVRTLYYRLNTYEAQGHYRRDRSSV
ncbi:MAG: response regulator [Phycisphaerales bacterium]|nr:response regulator [Phycisphaerales bacterium]